MSYVIVSMAPGIDQPIHVYGGPWPTKHLADVQLQKMDQADRQEYPDRQRVMFLVRKIITDPTEKV